MFSGDFNLPDVCWEYGPGLNWLYKKFKISTAYGYENNNLFLDILKDFALEKHVKEPTRSAYSHPQCVVLPSVFTITTHF